MIQSWRSSTNLVRRNREVACVTLLLVGVPSIASANVVWPALYVVGSTLWWIPIAIGLLIELLMIRLVFESSLVRSVRIDLVANLTSTVVGLFLIPVTGLAWELVASLALSPFLDWHTFNPVGWIMTFVLAAGVNALIEGAVFRWIFKLKLAFRSKKFGILFAANLITVCIAVALDEQTYPGFI